MTLEQFKKLVECFGSDLRSWPDSEREEGAAMLMQTPEARAFWREAQALDHLLLESAPEQAEPWMVDVIVERAQVMPQALTQTVHTTRPLLFLAWWPTRAAALAGVFLLGMALGLLIPSTQPEPENQVDIVSLIYDPTRMGGWTP